jgi:hypothetical protein
MSNPDELCIAEVAGTGFCVASDDGEKVHARIGSAFRSGRSVRLSFRGVTDLTSAFLNVAVGQLYGEFTEEEIRAKLSVTDASPDDLELLKRVVDRAKEFFKDPDRFTAAAKEVLGEDD